MIDRLVVIADDTKQNTFVVEVIQDTLLSVVHVLIFVDDQMFDFLAKQMNSNNTQAYAQGDIITYDFDDRQSEIDFIVAKIKQLTGAQYTKDGKTYGLDYDDMVILVSSVKKFPN